ncbi:ABC transporter permease [Spirochaetia bacterium]|nr:ABC transporter permease [Spirochaetia bacterium]
MKFIMMLQLALKYLFRYRRRYLFLFLALTFGFGIVTLITSVKDGMYENVYNSAQSHYAGDIITVGVHNSFFQMEHIPKDDIDTILRAIEDTNINPQHTVMRTLSPNGILYYNGSAVRLKYTTGVDWDTEESYFNSLDYRERRDVPEGENTILLSVPVAGKLGIRPGDSLILEVETRYGQSNTGVFVVGGIVEDSTIFGYYKAYVSRPVLNRLLLFRRDECSSIGMFLSDRREAETKRIILQNELADTILTSPLIQDRDELVREKDQPWKGVKIFVLGIPVYLSEVAELLAAMNIITYFLYGIMLVIILVSAMVTCNLILHEREREVGTMRAIGFYEGDVRFILILETMALGLLSLAAGFIFALLVSAGLRFIPLSWFPSLEIFMKNGRLTALYLPRTMLINLAAVFCIQLAAVWSPAFRSSRNPLPPMLSGGKS